MKMTKAQTKKVQAMTTTSGKIRYLNSLDMSRADIARFLDKRYQHVRNVLITPVKNVKV